MAESESRSAMTAHEAAYRALFHAVRDPCLLTRSDGRIEEVNAAAADLLGAFPAVLRGKPLAAFVDRPDRILFRRTLTRITAEERHAFLLLGLRYRAERVVPVAIECLAHEDDAGGIARLLWVAHPLDAPGGVEGPDEILEEFVRVRTAALREAREALEREHATLRDAVGRGALRYSRARSGEPRGRRGKSCATRHARPRPLRSLAAPSGRRASASTSVDWPVDRAVRTRQPVLDVRVAMQRPDGGLGELLASAAPILVDGRLRAVVGTFVDLGARSARDRADAEFLTNAAHNLRNPLTVISTAVEILQGGAKDEPAERDRFLEHIEREVAKDGPAHALAPHPCAGRRGAAAPTPPAGPGAGPAPLGGRRDRAAGERRARDQGRRPISSRSPTRGSWSKRSPTSRRTRRGTPGRGSSCSRARVRRAASAFA